uniref:Cilium assembly protein DZIP1 N-terminal domain-containing protein n=1 Tax=Tetradesmus obliquus TaxID=3088 RepID=A0A383VVD4_TETOB|eukprot:jgi/Sobl393_1/3107/SZX69171.1
MQQLQSSSGTLLSEQVLGNVADAREALEKADAAYNTALDKLEAEDGAARRHSLRRQRLEISWRVVFGVDMQQLVAKGDVQQLEQLLPQAAYGNILAEDPASLAPRHLRQLVLLGQACLDYLWAICMETSRIIKEQVQQLATASAAIPGLTTFTEELRGALAVALVSCLQSTQVDMTATAASGRCYAAATCSIPQHRSCSSPLCAHVRSVAPCSPVVQHCCSSPAAAGHCQHCSVPCCAGNSSTTVCYGATTAGGLLSSVLLPTAGNLRAKMDQLESNLSVEREKTEAMRHTLEEATAMLEQLPLGFQQQQQQQQQPPLSPPPVQPPVQQQQPPPSPKDLFVRTVSRSDSPVGTVRVVIDEENIRSQERQAAGQQLTQHIADIINHHELSKKLRLRSASGGGGSSSDGGSRRSPTVSFKSVPPRSSSGAGGAAAAATGLDAAAESPRWGSFSVSSAAAQLAASAAVQAAQQGRLRQQLQVVSSTATGAAAAAAARAEGPLQRSVSARGAAAAAGGEGLQQPAVKAQPRHSQVAVFGLPGLAQHVGHQMGIPGRLSQGPNA